MKFLLVFAHPDDETFSSGGTIAKLTSMGHKVNLATATRGEEGMVGDPPITTKEKIGEVREQELRNAAKILGISKIYFLGFWDGRLRYIKNKEIDEKILKVVKKEKPDVIITFDKFGGSNHPDHKAISRAATRVFEQYKKEATKHVRLYHTASPRSMIKKFEKMGLGYNAFGKVKGTKDSEITTMVNIKETKEIKIKALKEHKTQHKDWERFLERKDWSGSDYELFTLMSEKEIV